ncbi:MAG: glycosyltransferase family 2 protein [Bacteroidota bacterium]|nr:glycosyltransferase family 2 protein [Bacteroidota bacterium]MDX5429874.1 glycosyltransferase family 2 protein [Bacteroidota bacterium]MDX5468652.1 glycosyltransferase family 2 protein [Bacteroidota bacterium]
MKIFLTILLMIPLVYLGINVGYIFIFSLIARFSRDQKKPYNGEKNRFVLQYAAYKGDEVILDSIRQSRNQTYPNEYYQVQVIADQLKPETLSALREMGAQVVEVHFEKSTKAKSLNAGLDALSDDACDYVVIMDIDNVMDPHFLENLNAGLVDKPEVAQAHRIAKNMDTPMAILDALSEEINNSIFRKAHVAVGLSSALIGSGIAMRFGPYKALMKEIQAIGGFDKEMEVRLLKDRKKIAYIEYALVLDEKVQDAAIFENQRKRWLSAQFHYLRLYFFDSLKAFLLHQNFDYFNKVLQFMLLPRVLLLALSCLISAIAIVLVYIFHLPSLELAFGIDLNFKSWISLPLLILLSLYLATPSYLRTQKTVAALGTLPKTAWLMFLTLFRLRGANKSFIHTPHSNKK